MTQTSDQPSGSRVCPQCGYQMGPKDESCLRCALFAATDEPAPEATTPPGRPLSAGSSPGHAAPPPGAAPVSAAVSSALPRTMPPAPLSAQSPYAQTRANDARYANRGYAGSPQAERPLSVTVISVLMFIATFFMLLSLFFSRTFTSAFSNIIFLAVYGTLGWALWTLQPWARKWTIYTLLAAYALFLLFSAIGITRMQNDRKKDEAKVQYLQQLIAQAQRNHTPGTPPTDTSPETTPTPPGLTPSNLPPTPPVITPPDAAVVRQRQEQIRAAMRERYRRLEGVPAQNSVPGAPPQGDTPSSPSTAPPSLPDGSGSPGMTPAPAGSPLDSTPATPVMPSPSLQSGQDIVKNAEATGRRMAVDIFLIYAVVIAAVYGIFIFCLTRPVVIEAFGE